MEENKELLELLKTIEKSNRQQVNLARLSCVFALIAALCCVGVLALVYTALPQILAFLPQIESVIDQVQNVLSSLEDVATQLPLMDFGNMAGDVGALVSTAQESLEQLNNIDFKTLNKAIEDLAKVVEPLSKLTSIFK